MEALEAVKEANIMLAAYEPYLEQRLAEGVYDAHKLYGELQNRSYTGCETRVRDE